MPIFWYMISSQEQLHSYLRDTTRCRKNRIPASLAYSRKMTFGAHNWTRHRWLPESHLWTEQCRACKAVRLYRGNNTIYLDVPRSITRILIHTQAIPDPRSWNLYNPERNPPTRTFPQYPEFEDRTRLKRLIRKALKEANLKVHGIRRLLQ